jgi:hypothetical protein
VGVADEHQELRSASDLDEADDESDKRNERNNGEKNGNRSCADQIAEQEKAREGCSKSKTLIGSSHGTVIQELAERRLYQNAQSAAAMKKKENPVAA